MPAAPPTPADAGSWLRKAWRERGLVSALLWPLSLLYGAVTATHRQLYRSGILSVTRVGVPVIVVGNVTVGGGGKTPTVMEIATHLGARGLRVGVVSRGYGRRNADCVEVQPDDTADICGDEPLLLRRSLDIPVFVHANRARASQALLARHPHTQVIVCDDGLQHYGLYRDMEVCVIDAGGFGNDRLLPAGPLRQHWPPALVHAAGQDATRTLLLHTAGAAWPGRFSSHRRLAPQLTDAAGRTRTMVALAESAQPIVAIAAIAKPEAFFAMLRLQGLALSHTLALPDHDDFSHFARHAAAFPPGAVVICTQKDAAKLWPQCPQALAAVLEQRSEPAFFQALDTLLQARPS
ncbi:MAG: tetraacyldisaccharide 4'-kinase [Betaproteobacteria bacterium]|nr:tetraacyldisaccharide 4'-kinase [Betaproteobacteria bacterium]